MISNVYIIILNSVVYKIEDVNKEVTINMGVLIQGVVSKIWSGMNYRIFKTVVVFAKMKKD
jgi:hypothetical protein